MFSLFTIFVSILWMVTFGSVLNPSSTNKLIDFIKSKPSLSGAEVNFEALGSWSDLKDECEVRAHRSPKNLRFRSNITSNEIPDEFDARKKWPQCKSLQEIRDQGSCGSCWAVSSATVITDRHCIHKGQPVHFSAQQLVSCCEECNSEDGCQGAEPALAFKYYEEVGLVSGGNYKSGKGCYPYEIPTCKNYIQQKCHKTETFQVAPKCRTKCQSKYNVSFENDRHFGEEVQIELCPGEEMMKTEIFYGGPVVGSFEVYSDFFKYKSGVYRRKVNEEEMVYMHAIKILGWGEEDGQKYWLIANSFGENWGEKGFFKIARGTNECGIETLIRYSLPLR